MPRQARLDIPGALHHIMVRGNNKGEIFKDDQDRTHFLLRLRENIFETHCSVYAWVLMNNHVHILFKSGQKGISTVMRKLLTWYAIYYNHRHRRTGHLFENRYKSILCEEDTYLLALTRYIHLNPIRAKIITTIEDLDCYPWSGHGAVIGKAACPWMDTQYVLEQFGSTKQKAIKEYRRFIEEGINMGHIPELTGGGLIRSLGGWSQVLSTRNRKEKLEYDERILGSGDFVNEVLKETEEKHRRQIKAKRSGMTITQIIERECTKAKISPEELKNGSRRRKASEVRMAIALRGVEELGLSSAEIARHLGVATSSITRAIAKKER